MGENLLPKAVPAELRQSRALTAHHLRRTRHPREEQKRKHLFPCSDPDGYQAEPGPYSCRSRHDLHHACRTVRTLRVLLLAPCALHHRTAASCTSNPCIPFLHLSSLLSAITTRHAVAFDEGGNPPPCYSRADQSAAPTDYTTTPSCLLTPPRYARRVLCWLRRGRRGCRRDYYTPCRLRPSRASPARLSRGHRTLHAFCLKPESTPSAAWLAMSTAPRRAASASLAPSQAPSRALLRTHTTFRYVSDEPTRFPSSPLRGSFIPCQRPPPVE